jgi:hypothetical protein
MRLFTILFCSFFALSLQAQEWVTKMQDGRTNFYEVQNAFYRYWEQNSEAERKGKGYTQFKRWEWIMAPRVYPSGNRPDPEATAKVLAMIKREEIASKVSQTFPSWNIIGPTQIPFANGIAQQGGMGRVNFVTFHPASPDTIFIGTPAGGLWKSTNAGVTWTPLTDFLSVIGCSDLAIDSVNPQVMYLATGDRNGTDTYSIGLLKTIDGGQTWNTTGLNWTVTQTRTVRRVLINKANPNIIVAGTSEGIFYSGNGGNSFLQRSNTAVFDMEFAPNTSNVIYAAGNQFLRSTTNGLNWTAPFQTPTGWPTIGANRIELAVTPADSNVVYALLAGTNNGFGALVRSSDRGLSFTTMSTTPNILGWSPTGGDSGGQGWYDLALAASPLNANLIFTGGVNVWSSSNGGANWTIRGQWQGSGAPHIHADIHWLQFIPGQGNNLICGNDGGIYKLLNNSGSWIDLSTGLAIKQIYKMSQSVQNGAIIATGTQDNGSNLRDPNGSWKLVWGGDGMDNSIDAQNPSNIYVSSQYGNLGRSTNGGLNFFDIQNNGITETGAWVTPIDVSKVDPDRIIAGYDNLWVSDDKGNSWFKATNFSIGTKFDHLVFASTSRNLAYAARGSTLLRYDNVLNGTSVNITGGLPNLAISSITVHPTDSATLWITVSGYTSGQKVYQSTNMGVSWTNLSSNLPNLPANAFAFDPNAVQAMYVGTDVGVYYRDNQSSGWQKYSVGLPNVIINELEIHQGLQKLRAATYGRGMWEVDLYNVALLGTPTKPDLQYADDYVLYPNPSSGRLFIDQIGDQINEAHFSLFDLSGRQVFERQINQLVNELDIEGLSDGVYLFRISREGVEKRGKVVIRR